MRLVHVSDTDPGISRRRAGRGWAYYEPQGSLIRDPGVRARIDALAVPPAYADVWICPLENGHLQATGRDEKGRKQYRYHPDYRALREETKFAELADFGRALPELRAQVAADMRRRKLSRERVLATVVHLLERAHIRIGNDTYARENGSIGLTTMTEEHVEAGREVVRFTFTGKSGKERRLKLHDRRVSTTLRRLDDLPGQHLFQWEDDDGGVHRVQSGDVNDWLREVTGAEWTAKIFRTWAATAICAQALTEADPEVPRDRALLPAIDKAAKALGNTRAVCRSSYVHPAVLEAFEKDGWPGRRDMDGPVLGEERLSATERALLNLISN
ncbi:DNA topoisomerase IB [Pontivivens ytuae]|uniref:DNA topoisomerase n=1 Tax=Pontivivens ytuae TaxID=2789856 RepID=A0A7S9LSH3_9RHOB|nr:DNA topoisomerase IB [Pontivivens ytuae]QPH53895.1 DNA topoisomerase IB [Pontivivens ytuae]